jgi:thiol-disulfide isomerase/thioredoxin
MKKFSIISAMAFLTLFSGCALNKKPMRPKGNNIIYLQSTVVNHMQATQDEERSAAKEFLGVMGGNYQSYNPESFVINSLNDLPDERKTKVNIIMYGGNWCPDTHLGLPSFIRVLDDINFPVVNIQYHRVSHDKQQIDGKKADIEIKSVPTVVFYNTQTGEEIGRIVEFPRESWEEDLLNVLSFGVE